MTEPRGKHIFLFIWDTVRVDHVGLYGYPRSTTPRLDAMGQHADVYRYAISPSPFTMASVPSILAGKYPMEMKGMFTHGKFDEEDFEYLLDFKKRGYTLAYFTANIVTSTLRTNLNNFFDYVYDELPGEAVETGKDFLFQNGGEVTKKAIEYTTEHKDERLFIVVHLMEAHGPYPQHNDAVLFRDDELYRSDTRKIGRVVPDTFAGVTREMLEKHPVAPRYSLINVYETPDGGLEDFERNIREYIAHYDSGIRSLDNYLGTFLDFLQEQELYDGAEVIVTADHGELLGENNIYFAHGIMAHPALTHVPLVIKRPGQRERRDIEENTSLLSVVCPPDEEATTKVVKSYHPKSLGALFEDYYAMYHNGDFHHTETYREMIFPTKNLSPEEVFVNFEEITIEAQIVFFKKENGALVRMEDGPNSMLLPAYIDSQRHIFKLLKDMYAHTKAERDTYKKRADALARENQRLAEKADKAEHDYAAVQNTRFFALWRRYCTIRDRLFK